MNNSNELTASALSDAEQQENSCENIGSHAPEQQVSDAISLAVSLPVSPSTDENYITESDGSKWSSQPSDKSKLKPNCYECKYRRPVPGDAHSQCVHPILDVVPGGKFIPMMFMMRGLRSPIEKRLNLSYSQHGFNSGWFMWPVNFDPTWLETCEGFEHK